MKPRNTIEEKLKVPSDILLDIFTIVAKEKIRHEVRQVMEVRGLVILSLYLSDSQPQERAFQNIQSIIEEYNEYRYSENEEFNWRD